jgi:hypothetical protein
MRDRDHYLYSTRLTEWSHHSGQISIDTIGRGERNKLIFVLGADGVGKHWRSDTSTEEREVVGYY